MSNAPLPSQVDVRKLAAKGAEMHAVTSVASLPRIVDMLASDSGSVKVDLHFYVDEESIRRLDGQLKASVRVFCQRCMEPMPLELSADFALGIVWSEDDARRLPRSLDPLIVGDEFTDIADVVSEELILSMPFVSYHTEGECSRQSGYSVGADTGASESAGSEQAGSERENPFKVLEQLKLDK